MTYHPSQNSIRASGQSKADNLAFTLHGSRDAAVLLIHGVTGSPVEMKYVAKALHRRGYTVSAPLLAGHGIDAATLRASTWSDWYRSVSVAADQLARSFERIYVAGVCIGGLLGMHLAARDSRIRAATVYSPLFNYDGWNTPFYYRLNEFTVPLAVHLGVSRWISLRERHPFGIKSSRRRALLADGMRGTLPAFPVDTLHQNLQLIRATRAILPRVSVPALVIHAQEDDLSSPANALYLQRHIGGPCEIAWMHNSYHMVHVDQEHPEVASRTCAFFDRMTVAP